MQSSRRTRLRNQLRNRSTQWQSAIDEFGTPLLILEPHAAVRRLREMRRKIPGLDPYYAVKALPHPAVLTGLAMAGCGFDVATSWEVDLVRSLGIPMNRCIYTHPVKKPTEIDHAYAAGVRTFVVDSLGEAQKFLGRPADVDVLVRLAFANPTAKCDLSTKFGAAPPDAELIVKQILAAGVGFGGFSFHVGSQTATVEPYRTALRHTLALADQLRSTLGVETPLIDIGGGFPVTYREDMPSFDSIAAVVNSTIEESGVDRSRLNLIAEPGRFLAAPCMTLLASVVGTTVRDGRTWHYLDDGLYGSYSNVLTENVHPPILSLREMQTATVGPEAAPDVRRMELVTLAGPTCDSTDVVARDYPMPSLAPGDVVVSPMMGAYTTVTSSRFNGIAATPIVVAQRSASTVTSSN